MRKTREILRLHFEAGCSLREIVRSAGVALSTVQSCLSRAKAAGLSWPLPADWDDARIDQALYPPTPRAGSPALPDFSAMAQALRRKGMTLALLWQEYKQQHAEGLQYSQFCEHYRRWCGRQDIVLRRAHVPGDKLFLDYAGQTMEVVDRGTGEVRNAQIFVAVLGASNYTYAEATWTQSLPDWLGAQRRALECFGGVPAALVPDNLKSAVSKALRYEPDLNPAYQEFAEHYGTAILPARVRKPRDKGKVENGVLLVERWILARLRHHTFFSLAELNAQVHQLCRELNQRPFKKRDGCRASLFAEIERPALRPLPAHGYEFGQWKQAKVHLDYHIEVEHRYYSVPYQWVGERVDVRLSASTVEIFRKGQRIALHRRVERRGDFRTLDEHRPAKHQAVVNLDFERLLRQAERIGPNTIAVLRAQAGRRLHPEQSIRSAQGILRLARDFSPSALEAACARALAIRSYSYRSVRQLLQLPAPEQPPQLPLIAHDNLRGADYYKESSSC